MDTKKFAECMKRNMEANGIATEKLSGMTGSSVSRLEEMETGDIKPKSKELFAIGEAIKVLLEKKFFLYVL